MDLHGRNLIGGEPVAAGSVPIRAVNPRTGEVLGPVFLEATPEEVDAAARLADDAYLADGRKLPEERANLLEAFAQEIEELGEVLVERACEETGLPEARIRGERGRTTGQLGMFAKLVREGSWVEARIDRAQPNRIPLPKPDVRRMLVPLGPVAVFGASNFPLAFSVAGGDTASAIAAGCPVVCKGHPAHPGTSELVGTALSKAVRGVGFHPGTFSLVHGISPETSLTLVRHPLIKAVGFTGSLQAGRALFDAASQRPEPIPVFAEMGSVNPVFVLPGALAERGAAIAEGYVGSLTLGSGQFCTNPGLLFGLESPGLDAFAQSVGEVIRMSSPQTLLHAGIQSSFRAGVKEWTATEGVGYVGEELEVGGEAEAGEESEVGDEQGTWVRAAVFVTEGRSFVRNPHLAKELFGPASLMVRAGDPEELMKIAEGLDGNLTATIHGTREDLSGYGELVHILERKVGRLVFNGFPTGVEVCPAMHHGGPYPATTDVRSTSVGTGAVFRFARPLAWQGFPQSALPPELRDENPRGIWRMVDGEMTRGAI